MTYKYLIILSGIVSSVKFNEGIKSMKRICSFIIPIIIAVVAAILSNNILDKKISYLSETKDLAKFAANYGDFKKDRSIVAKRVLGENGDLFLLGSSEMKIDVPQNTLKLFPIKGAEYNVSSFGRGYSQNLQQASMIGACNLKPDQKLAYIVSIQWFDDEAGIKPDKFASNFSDIGFYEFLNNPKISENNKMYYANRTYELLSKANKFKPEALYAKLYCSNSFSSKIIRNILKPYYVTKIYLSEIKDKALIYSELKELPDKSDDSKEYKEVDWNKEYNELLKESEETKSSNEFQLTDKYYNDNVKDIKDYVKGLLASQEITKSVELDDFKFFLSVCNDLGIKPYIIIPPVNGWYYDYLGLNVDERNKYYDTIDSLAGNDDMDVLDLRKYEYQKDFLMDVMHLGKEGWLKVSEGIYNHFNKK